MRLLILLMDCVFSAVWGAVLFSEVPTAQTVLGGGAVIQGILLYTGGETYLDKRHPQKSDPAE